MLQYKIKIYEKEYIEVNLNLVEFRGKLKKLTNMWRLNNMLLISQWVKEELYLEEMETGHT